MMLLAVGVLLMTAAVAPLVVRAKAATAGWLLAISPAAVTAWAFSQLMAPDGFTPLEETWHWASSLGVDLVFRLDGLALLFVLLICGIGTLILIYAGQYLHDDRRLGRFFAMLLVFMASMTGLVMADNVYLLFVFWEMTSISSFLLIGWDHYRAEARKAATTALFITGGGGLCLMAGLVILNLLTGEVNLSQMNAEALVQGPMAAAAVVLVILGAATKSAQFPFHFWLPGAMAAPTPVSAYLHSATMVKAGVYLLARTSPLLGEHWLWDDILIPLGAATMLLGAIASVMQKDLKRILAYSTVCVLGLLVMLLGIGSEEAIVAMLVYLVAHSLYKGALFMGAGTLDHETSTRDITQLRGLARLMPVSATVAVLAAASSAGMIPLLGFVAKDLFYEAAMHVPMVGMVLFGCGFVASVMLVMVAWMVGWRPYFGGQPLAPRMPHEAPLALWLGGAVLALLGVALGVMPWLLGDELVTAAAGDVHASPVTVKLAMWHGLTLVLGLSALTILAGSVLFFFCRRWHGPWCDFGEKISGLGPAVLYDRAFDTLMAFAHLMAHFLQNGYLRNYVLVIVMTLIALVAWPMAQSLPLVSELLDSGTLTTSDIVISIVIIAAAIAVHRINSRMGILAVLGSIGIMVMLVFVIFGAMDLALTQIMVETLTVVLLVLVIYHLPRFVPMSSWYILARDAVISLLFGGVMTMLVLMSATLHPRTEMREFFVENSYKLGHGRNIVNVILVDYRALDTMGEITVLAAAGIGVLALLKIRVKKEK